ncbi:MAG: ABC transporter ATP-binding protein [Candidatus Kapabacteria bacterium]|nr:ABC transporter ATP-binding protein [Ignavibacteriota bacterium]MCW5885240.1 ABC transporter ATP-binding protein [Candidatus Kapabacteria bacterium]
MIKFNYIVKDLSKSFIRKHFIFRNLNLNFTNGSIIALTGSNGSGKSTLVKVMTGVLSHTSGSIDLKVDDKKVSFNDVKDEIALVAPYLNLYEEFTPIEHYKVSADLRAVNPDYDKLNRQLTDFKLIRHKNTPIRNFSSGMKQRMKFILALQTNPTILFLDEPTTNLDLDGIEIINKIIVNHAAGGGAVVIATNEEREKSLCSHCYEVSNQ